MFLKTPIENLPATSNITIRKFKLLNIKTYWDLLNYFPFRYENYSLVSAIEKVQEGEIVSIKGYVAEVKQHIVKSGLRIQKFILQDHTGEIELNWYNQPYLLTIIKKGIKLSVAGQVKRFGQKLVMNPTEYEVGNCLIHTGRIVPIYPEKKGLSSRTIREKIFYILSQLLKNSKLEINNNQIDILPEEIRNNNNLIDEITAYYNIHFPQNYELAKKARNRLSFNELFLYQLNAALTRQEWDKEIVGYQFIVDENNKFLLQKFVNNLPFKLTSAQKRVWSEILEDLQRQKPMNRLLQGDVGSGKTVIAALACYFAYLNGFQSLIMAPTEILAFQHYKTITKLFNNYPVKIGIHTSSKKITNKDSTITDFDIVLGTHALIQQKISFERVALVVIDEQHRFGVSQRAMLKKKGINPHLLTMTATPIPRTVALTLYGELDISRIDEMPKGRLPIKTFIVPKAKRNNCYQWVKKQILNHNIQAFIICPLIDQSNTETMKSVKAATKEYQFLKEKIFTDFSLGLLHGKMKAKEKERIMNEFKNKKYHLLVTTPVVEVGIDIENATIMIIEGAQRFGLAQLHQLRGRVGRGDKQSYCFLFTDSQNSEVIERLEFFAKTNDGNLLAERDLQLRGPGNIYGTQQHGEIELKIASLSNFALIEKTKKAVKYFIDHYNLEEFKNLKQRIEEYKLSQISKD